MKIKKGKLYYNYQLECVIKASVDSDDKDGIHSDKIAVHCPTKEAFDYENKLKSLHKEFKYIPLIFFNGLQECFYKINLHL